MVDPTRRPSIAKSSFTDDYAPSYRAAAFAGLVVFALYCLTLSPSTALWDTGEYMAAIKGLGIPHPPGNPFFILIGHVFGDLPLPGSYAQRINTMAALASAISAGLWFLIAERIFAGWLGKRGQRLIGAAFAALIGATAFTVWNQSVVSEKVYTMSLLFFTAVSWLVVSWADNPDAPKAENKLLLVAFLLGLGYSNHPAGFLAVPAAGVAILARRWQTLLDWRLITKALLLLALGLTPFLYQPIRAAHFPPMNMGEATACTTKLEVSCTFTALTRDRLMANINRDQFGEKIERGAPLSAQVGMWWLYFKWQWLRDARDELPALQGLLAVIFFALGSIGGFVHWKRERRTFWYFGPLMFTLTLALVYYMNFKYGWSQSPELGQSVDREVRDRDYFYIWSFSAWGVWAAVGLVFVWHSVAALFERASPQGGSQGRGLGTRSLFAASPVLLVALVPLVANWSAASHRGDTFAADWGADVLNSVEPYGVLITSGDNDTFPLWYAQEVEGVRQDVLVLVTSLLNTDWYVRQAIRNPVREYDAARGPAIYRSATWRKPHGPPLKLSFDEADAIPEYVQVHEPQIFRHGQLVAAIQPGYLTRDQLVTLRLIKDSILERPVYFAAGGYGRSLGLDPYTLRQGLVDKLLVRPVIPGADTLKVGASFVDVHRSYALWTEVYKGPAELVDEGDWVDRPSYGIPYAYAFTGYALARALTAQGRAEDSASILRTVQEIVRVARLNELFPGTEIP